MAIDNAVSVSQFILRLCYATLRSSKAAMLHLKLNAEVGVKQVM